MKKKNTTYIALYLIYFMIFAISTTMTLYFTVGDKPKFMYDILSAFNTKYTITGTYYLQRSTDNIDNSIYIVLDSGAIGDKLNEGDWRDSDGLRGKYEYSSGNITFYDGSKTYPILSGTIKDDKLVIKTGEYSQTTYVKR